MESKHTEQTTDGLCTPGDEHRETPMESIMLARLIDSTAHCTPAPFFDEDDKTGVQSCLLHRSSAANTSNTPWFRNHFQSGQ